MAVERHYWIWDGEDGRRYKRVVMSPGGKFADSIQEFECRDGRWQLLPDGIPEGVLRKEIENGVGAGFDVC